jgi:pyridoxal phosphate enzyme (YggS family)
LVAVTKGVDLSAVHEALGTGILDLGENFVQEAAEKAAALARAPADAHDPRPRWHLIGPLQRNKAARAARLFHLIHTLDGDALAARLDRIGQEVGRRIPTLLQVNVAGEPTKHGVAGDAVAGVLEHARRLTHLRIDGLMTVPPHAAEPEASRAHFRALARLRDDLRTRGFDLPHLSMGMTDDYEIAVEEGATMVRVGRAIFGPRPVKR